MAMPVAASMAKENEKEAHRYLWSHRSHGEWFKVSDEEGVDAVERALLEVTRRYAARGSARPNAAIDLSTAEGQAIFEQRLRRTRHAP